MVFKRPNFAEIPRNTIIPIMPQQHHTQPFTYNRYGPMKTPSEFTLDLHEFRPHPLGNRIPQHRKPSLTGLAAYMGKPKKIKCLWFSLALTDL